MSTAGSLGVAWRQYDTSAEIHGAINALQDLRTN